MREWRAFSVPIHTEGIEGNRSATFHSHIACSGGYGAGRVHGCDQGDFELRGINFVAFTTIIQRHGLCFSEQRQCARGGNADVHRIRDWIIE